MRCTVTSCFVLQNKLTLLIAKYLKAMYFLLASENYFGKSWVVSCHLTSFFPRQIKSLRNITVGLLIMRALVGLITYFERARRPRSRSLVRPRTHHPFSYWIPLSHLC